MPTLGLYQHPDCSRHATGWNPPAHQGRLRAVMGALERTLPDLHEDVLPILAEPALEPDLEMVHTRNHIGRVRSA